MSEAFSKVVQLMARLRAPGGCPWDRKQTHESLKPYLVEESYEVLEAIDHLDPKSLKEELGDLLLQILFHAQIAAERDTFTIDDVVLQLADKLVRRHPHVFGEDAEKRGAGTAEEVLTRWEEIKRNERNQKDQTNSDRSVLSGVPKTLPALLRAYQVQARTSRVGFDWPHTREGHEMVLAKVEEEIRELREALASSGTHRADHVEAEFGDLLFALVNLGRLLKVNPEEALRLATNRFTERFRFIEQEATRQGRTLEQMTLTEMDALWEAAKQRESRPEIRKP
jgi:tetrapyrrole methylase family protein/MazG family protein